MVATLSVCFVSCGGDDDDTINPDISQGGDSNTDETIVGTAVDLGLSVMFADRNVGAKNVEDLGTLYAWAETETKTEFTLENYFDRDFTKVTADPEITARTSPMCPVRRRFPIPYLYNKDCSSQTGEPPSLQIRQSTARQ